MTAFALLATAALGLLAGVFIGCIGVGGVIIVPALVQIGGLPVHIAIAVAMAGYILTGIVGTWVYVRHGTIDWTLARVLCIGAMPSAIAGALVARITPPLLLEFVIGMMTAASGLHALLRRPKPGDEPPRTSLAPPQGLSIGAVAGFISALTGTGGPAALIPLLLWLDVAVLKTVGLAQVIQLPIAVLATIGNAAAGTIDPTPGAALGIGLTVGTPAGAALAHRLDQKLLRYLVAAMLVAVGALLMLKVAKGVFSA